MSNVDALNNQTLNNMKKALEDAAGKRYPEQLVAIAKQVLATETGSMLLNEMTNFYMNRPFCPPGSVEGMGYWRDGQASVIRDLWAIMNMKTTGVK